MPMYSRAVALSLLADNTIETIVIHVNNYWINNKKSIVVLYLWWWLMKNDDEEEMIFFFLLLYIFLAHQPQHASRRHRYAEWVSALQNTSDSLWNGYATSLCVNIERQETRAHSLELLFRTHQLLAPDSAADWNLWRWPYDNFQRECLRCI